MDLEEFCKLLPKVELHAHLAGSVSKKTINLLQLPKCADKIMDNYESVEYSTRIQSVQYEQVFKLFDTIHQVMDRKSAVYLATIETIREFYEDNVFYLELRTTPRRCFDMTKRDYIETVVSAITESSAMKNMTIKLILCIDRTHPLKESEENLKLILEMKGIYPNIIVGIDLCGNPGKGKFPENIFETARKSGLKVTLHCAEYANHKDNDKMICFKPDRIGHGSYLHPKYGGTLNTFNKFTPLALPLEICLTSNIICAVYPNGYEDHHIKEWIDLKLPFCLCTDDKGVFNTNLSKEYFIAAKAFNLSKNSLFDISNCAIDYSFASEDEKEVLRKYLVQWKVEHKNLLDAK